jgi:hypothetical protein
MSDARLILINRLTNRGAGSSNVSMIAGILLLFLARLPAVAQEHQAPLDRACLEIHAQAQDLIQAGDPNRAEITLLAALKDPNFQPPACEAVVLADLAWVMLLSGRRAETEIFARRSLVILARIYSPDSPAHLHPLHSLGIAYLQQEKTGRARRVVERMKSLSLSRADERSLVHSMAMSLLVAEGRFKEAESECLDTLASYKEAGRMFSADFGSTQIVLAEIYLRLHRTVDAEHALLRGQQVLESAADTAVFDRLGALHVRASLRAAQSRWADSEQDLLQALTLAERENSVPPARIGILLDQYALVLRKMHRKREARAATARAVAFWRGHPELNQVVDVSSSIRPAGVR